MKEYSRSSQMSAGAEVNNERKHQLLRFGLYKGEGELYANSGTDIKYDAVGICLLAGCESAHNVEKPTTDDTIY